MENDTATKDISSRPSKFDTFKRAYLDHTTQFGFEYFMTLFSVLVTSTFVVYALFVIANYVIGFNNSYGSRTIGEIALWVAAAMMVWLPVTLVFYLRSQATIERVPEVKHKTLPRVLTSIFLFFTITTAIVLAFVTIITLLRTLVGIDESSNDILGQVALPAFLSAVLFGWISAYWFRPGLHSRRKFAFIFSVVSLVALVTVLILSIGSMRGYAQDQKINNVLTVVSAKISQEYRRNSSLPNDLKTLPDLDEKTRNSLPHIEYIAEKNGKYQLCSTFATDTLDDRYATIGNNDYSSYHSFSTHDKGKYCFKMMAGSPYEYHYDSYFDSQTN